MVTSWDTAFYNDLREAASVLLKLLSDLTESLLRPLQEGKTVKVDIHHFYPTLTYTLFLSELLCAMIWSMHCPPQAACGILPLLGFYYRCIKFFPFCVFICLSILFMAFSVMQFLVFIWIYHIFFCLWRTVFFVLTFSYLIVFFIVVVVVWLLFLFALVLCFETTSLSSRAELTLFTQASSSPSEFQDNRASLRWLTLFTFASRISFFPLFVMRCESYFSISFP